MQRFIDMLFEQERRLIAPIWDRGADLKFSCWGFIGFAEAMGFSSYQATDNIVRICDDSLPDNEALRQISRKGFFDQQMFENELAVLEGIKEKNSIPVGGGCFGPLTIAGAILGAERMMMLSIEDPQFVEDTVAYVTEKIISLAQEESKLGIDFFWIAEPVFSLFSPQAVERFSVKYLKDIYSSVSDAGFLHVCGKTLKHTQAMVDSGAQVLSIDYVTDIGKCIRMVPNDVVIMGNLNPLLIRYGTPEEIVQATNSINNTCKNYKNFVFSSGCLVPKGTPKENEIAMIETVKNYSIFNNDEYKTIRKLTSLALNNDRCFSQVALAEDQNLVRIAQEEAALIQKYQKEA